MYYLRRPSSVLAVFRSVVWKNPLVSMWGRSESNFGGQRRRWRKFRADRWRETRNVAMSMPNMNKPHNRAPEWLLSSRSHCVNGCYRICWWYLSLFFSNRCFKWTKSLTIKLKGHCLISRNYFIVDNAFLFPPDEDLSRTQPMAPSP